MFLNNLILYYMLHIMHTYIHTASPQKREKKKDESVHIY